MSSYLLDLGNADAHCLLRRVSYDPPAPVSYAPRFDAHCPNMTVTERFATSRYYCLMPVHARGGLTVTAEMQAYGEDAEMTFEVYARGWLERQTKYAPYDRLLPTFARNRVPGVGGMGSYFYHSSFTASATSCAMRCRSSSLSARAYGSSAASRFCSASRVHASNSALVISFRIVRA